MTKTDQLVEAIAMEAADMALAKLRPEMQIAIDHRVCDQARILTIGAAMKIFGVSRDVITGILNEYKIPVKLIERGGLGPAKLFIYSDFEKALRKWVKA